MVQAAQPSGRFAADVGPFFFRQNHGVFAKPIIARIT